MGNLHEVVAAQCAVVEEHEDEVVMKTIEQYTSVVVVQTPKVAPEPEAEGGVATEDQKPELNHENKPDDLDEGKEVGGETKEENVYEITEKIDGVGIGKEEEAGKELDAAKEKPENDEDVKAEANADGNEEDETNK